MRLNTSCIAFPDIDSFEKSSPTQTVIIAWILLNYEFSGNSLALCEQHAPTDTLTFTAGQITKLITIQVRGDTTVEEIESSSVSLTTASRAVFEIANANETIVDDEAVASSQFGAFGDQDIKKCFPPLRLSTQHYAASRASVP